MKRKAGPPPPQAPPRAAPPVRVAASADEEPRHAIAWWAATVVLALVALGPSLGGDWLWDDEALVVAPRFMRDLAGLGRLWRGEGTLDYFPLTSTSFWLERRLFDGPLGHRIDNLALHAVNACLVGTLALRAGIPNGRALGLLFAVHPLAVSSAAWVSERKNTLSLLLGLLALLVALPRARTWPTRGELGASVVLFALCLLAKTQLVGLPVVLATLLALRGRPPREAWGAIAAMLLTALALGLVTVRFQDAPTPADVGSPLERVVRAADAVVFYLGRTAWPSPLAMVHARDAVSGTSARGWLALATLALGGSALAVAAARGARRGRVALALLLAYLSLLAPTLGFLDMAFMRFAYVAEHFTYPALAVPLAALVLALSRLPPRPMLAAVAAIAVALGVVSHGYAEVFTSRARLWAHNVEVVPTSATALGNHALALQERGRPREALRSAREAVRRSPDDAELHCFLGVVLLQQLVIDEARRELETALALDPDLARAHNNLASLLVHEGDLAGGTRHLREAVRLEPDYALGHLNLARVLAAQGRMDEAERERHAAVELDDALAAVPLLPEARRP